MVKYPQSQALFNRLLTEAGFRKDGGQFDKKRFCETTGISPRMYNYYKMGESNLTAQKVKEIAEKVGLKEFNII